MLEPQGEAAQFFRRLQLEICAALEAIDRTGRFVEDPWQRDGGGGGFTRVLSGGSVFEKAGVNWSQVMGTLEPSFAKFLPGDGVSFMATGVSLVLHPENPHVPTVHANFRKVEKGDARWFGGGADLTPYYPNLNDVHHFHSVFKSACDHHHPRWYSIFKKWCDDYFFLPHRNETRGVGGIFFDYVGIGANELSGPPREHSRYALEDAIPESAAFAFVQDVGRAFLDAYLPIVKERAPTPYSEVQRNFQLLRRGRYVEFNLLYDRGTQFGLRTNGRTESILMSLPPLVRWEYDFHPKPDSAEAMAIEFLKPTDWLGLHETET